MIKKIILFPVLVLTLAMSTTTFADMKYHGQCKYKNKMGKLHKWQKSLNLTEEQKAKMKSIREESRAEIKEIYKKMNELRTETRTLVTSDKMDENKLNELVDKKKELMGQKLKLKLQAKNKMYNILDDQQKKKLSEMMQNCKRKK